MSIWDWFDYQKGKAQRDLQRVRCEVIQDGWIAVSKAFREIAFLLFYRWYFSGG